MGDELTAARTMQRGGEADLHAELVGLVRLALADALDLGRVQAADLAATLATILIEHAPGQVKRPDERLSQPLVAGAETLITIAAAATLIRRWP